MIPTHVVARRPLIGAVAGLLLVSACGTAAESTPTPTMPLTDIVIDGAPETTQAAPASTMSDATVASTTPSTTPTPSTSAAPAAADQSTTTTPPASPTTHPPTTSPQATVLPAGSTPIDAVDVSGRTVFGVSVFDAVDVDAVVGDVSARVGSPTTDSGWQSTGGQSCAGSTDFRVLWWGGFRMAFERYQGDGAMRDELSAWTVGDPTLFGLAPIGDVPAPSPSNIVTLEGIGLGSTLADVGAAWANINNAGDDRLVVVDRGGTLTIRLDNGDQIVGFGDGPFDCPADETR